MISFLRVLTHAASWPDQLVWPPLKLCSVSVVVVEQYFDQNQYYIASIYRYPVLAAFGKLSFSPFLGQLFS